MIDRDLHVQPITDLLKQSQCSVRVRLEKQRSQASLRRPSAITTPDLIWRILPQLGVNPEETFHWQTHQGAELDLLIVRGALRLGFEVKRTVAPTLTPSMRSALHDLKLKSLTVVHAGNATFPLSKHVQAVAVDDLLKIVQSLR
jgi:hypothetical protein